MGLLPVKYCGQKNAWMTANLFHDWFHHQFVPHVRKKLMSWRETHGPFAAG